MHSKRIASGAAGAWRNGLVGWSVCIAACGGSLVAAATDGGTRTTADGSDGAMPAAIADAIADAGFDDADSPSRIDASDGVATVHGTLGGQRFSARGAIAFYDNDNVAQPNLAPPSVNVDIPGNFDLTCGFTKSYAKNYEWAQFADAAELVIAVQTAPGVTQGVANPPWPPLGAGTYPVTPSEAGAPTSMSAYVTLNADCGTLTSVDASDGSVTLTAVDATHVAGTFEFTFPNGERVTGDFSAPLCHGLVPSPITGPPRTVCVP